MPQRYRISYQKVNKKLAPCIEIMWIWLEFRSEFELKLDIFCVCGMWAWSEKFINFSVTINFSSCSFPADSIKLWTFTRIIINYILLQWSPLKELCLIVNVTAPHKKNAVRFDGCASEYVDLCVWYVCILFVVLFYRFESHFQYVWGGYKTESEFGELVIISRQENKRKDKNHKTTSGYVALCKPFQRVLCRRHIIISSPVFLGLCEN